MLLCLHVVLPMICSKGHMRPFNLELVPFLRSVPLQTVEVLLPQNSLSFATIVEVWVVFFPYPSHLVASHLNPPLLSPCNIASPSLWTCLLEHSDLISFSFSCEHMFCKGKRLKKKKNTQPRLQHHQGNTFKIAHQPNANCIRLVAGIGSSRQQSKVIWERPCLTQISTPRSVF